MQHGLPRLATTWPPRARPRCCSATTRPTRSKLFGAAKNPTRYTKDGINDRVVERRHRRRSTRRLAGTKVALLVRLRRRRPGRDRRGPAAAARTSRRTRRPSAPGSTRVFDDRKREADEFYATVIHPGLSDEDRHVARRAYAGLLWGKQLYRYDVDEWMEGDPAEPAGAGSASGSGARNPHWRHLALADVISMPDEWEYPWFAAWDTGLPRHPAGPRRPGFRQGTAGADVPGMVDAPQRPAARLRMGVRRRQPAGARLGGLARLPDRRLPRPRVPRPGLHQAAAQLLLVGQPQGRRRAPTSSRAASSGWTTSALFNRSAPLPPGFRLEQSDATSWMAFYCQQMFKIALELSRHDQAWDEIGDQVPGALPVHRQGDELLRLARHVAVARGGRLLLRRAGQPGRHGRSTCGSGRWSGCCRSWAPPRCRPGSPRSAPTSPSRLRWLQRRRPELVGPLLSRSGPGGRRMLLSLVDPDRLRRILRADVRLRGVPVAVRHPLAVRGRPGDGDRRGQRAARVHRVRAGGVADRHVRRQLQLARAGLVPGQRAAGRQAAHLRPALRRLVHDRDPHRLGQSLHSGAGGRPHRRRPDRAVPAGRRQAAGRRRADRGQRQPAVEEHPTFCEYFDGDTGEGLGATHQTGWTALVAHLLNPRLPPDPRFS